MMLKRSSSLLLIGSVLAVAGLPGLSQGRPQRGAMLSGALGGMNASNPFTVLGRQDVQKHLGLDYNQRKALATLQQESTAALRTQVRVAAGGARGAAPGQRPQADELQAAVQEQVAQFQGVQQGQVNEILKPEQQTRLAELDLQFRGPLAMADPKVAKQVNLSQAHQTEISKINSSFLAESATLMREVMLEIRQSGRSQQRQPAPQAVQREVADAQKKVELLREAAGDKVLALLSPEELEAWKKLLGEKFTFRNLPGTPRQKD